MAAQNVCGRLAGCQSAAARQQPEQTLVAHLLADDRARAPAARDRAAGAGNFAAATGFTRGTAAGAAARAAPRGGGTHGAGSRGRAGFRLLFRRRDWLRFLRRFDELGFLGGLLEHQPRKLLLHPGHVVARRVVDEISNEEKMAKQGTDQRHGETAIERLPPVKLEFLGESKASVRCAVE